MTGFRFAPHIALFQIHYLELGLITPTPTTIFTGSFSYIHMALLDHWLFSRNFPYSSIQFSIWVLNYAELEMVQLLVWNSWLLASLWLPSPVKQHFSGFFLNLIICLMRSLIFYLNCTYFLLNLTDHIQYFSVSISDTELKCKVLVKLTCDLLL